MYKNLYGSEWIAARYCGFKAPPYEAEGLWMHGWVWKDILIEEQLFGTNIEDKNTKLFVANEWQKNFLIMKGYSQVYSIGLPNVYLEKKEIEKKQSSLIVMPAHNIAGMNHNIKRESEYIDFIKSIENNFETVTVCINAYDFKNGNWSKQFERAGIKTIMGVYDGPNALQEQQDRLTSFTHMTTNQIGSHVVYASALGLKVSIAGPYYEHLKCSLEGTEFYKKHPLALDNVITRSTENYWRQKAPWLFCSPSEAIESIAWGRNECGYDNCKNKEEIINLFGWNIAKNNNLEKVTSSINDLRTELMNVQSVVEKQAAYIKELEQACYDRLELIKNLEKNRIDLEKRMHDLQK